MAASVSRTRNHEILCKAVGEPLAGKLRGRRLTLLQILDKSIQDKLVEYIFLRILHKENPWIANVLDAYKTLLVHHGRNIKIASKDIEALKQQAEAKIDHLFTSRSLPEPQSHFELLFGLESIRNLRILQIAVGKPLAEKLEEGTLTLAEALDESFQQKLTEFTVRETLRCNDVQVSVSNGYHALLTQLGRETIKAYEYLHAWGKNTSEKVVRVFSPRDTLPSTLLILDDSQVCLGLLIVD
jgi:hypothetical protein